MKKACIVTHPFYCNNRLFDLDDIISNRDNCLYLFYELKKAFRQLNIDLSTHDINSIEESDIVIYNEMPDILPKEENIKKSYLILFESELIKPANWDLKSHLYFNKIFTWDDRFVNNINYFKSNFAHKIIKKLDIDTIIKNKVNLCTLVAGNKNLKHSLELYSKRIEIIEWFEKNHSEYFDLYGMGWENGFQKKIPKYLKPFKKLNFIKEKYKLKFPSYKGRLETKLGVMSKYKYAICYENAKDIPGYITEKIFDCFFAGCVPIYWGASNITDYIPENCFIDQRKFNSYEKLYEFLVKITANEYYDYLSNIKNYLNSEAIKQFSCEFFAENIIHTIFHI